MDDGLMGITHVLRGEDLLSSTPRQIHLLKLLGLPIPSYVHVPLLLDDSGQKLSKRQGSTTLTALRARGLQPGRVVAALAHSAGLTDEPCVRVENLIDGFSIDKITRLPNAIDMTRFPEFTV